MFKKLTISLLVFAFAIHLQAQTSTTNTVNPPVVIPNTHTVNLMSSVVEGQEYTLQINLPGNYSDTSKTFPVLYLLDSQWDFSLLVAINGEQYYDGFIPGVITVGITWGGREPNYDKLRGRDFTPTSSQQIENSGKAALFLSFIKKELIPFVESRYRTNKKDRVLMGSSLGGLFTLYAMFHETALFNKYVLTSPSINWDEGVTYKYEKEYAAKHTDLPVRLFMAQGEAEGNVENFQKWTNLLKSHNYKGLEMQTRVLENTGHSGTKAEGYTRGLQWAFKRPEVQLADAVLKQYVGSYVADNVTFKVVVENHKLVGIAPDNQRALFTAANEEEFYSKEAKVSLRFKKEQGKITGFLLDMNGKEIFARRVE
jgi:predicted alpha/beta superfamily hydrolase